MLAAALITTKRGIGLPNKIDVKFFDFLIAL